MVDDTCKVCADGTYVSDTKKDCIPCTAGLNCATCTNGRKCTSCLSGFNLDSYSNCAPISTGEFEYGLKVSNGVISTSVNAPPGVPTQQFRDYMRNNAGSLSLFAATPDGQSVMNKLGFEPLPGTEQEYGTGQVKFALDYKEPTDPMQIQVSLHSPAPIGRRPGRVLQSNQTEQKDYETDPTIVSKRPKLLRLPSGYPVDASTQVRYLHLLYIPVSICVLWLVIGRNLYSNSESIKEHFSLVQSIMSIQLIYLTGMYAVSFRGGMDKVLSGGTRGMYHILGMDLEVHILTDQDNRNMINTYYLGKYTLEGLNPYMIERLFIPTILYILLCVLSFLPICPSRVAICRLAVLSTTLIQYIHVGSINIILFIMARQFNVFAIVSIVVVCGVVGMGGRDLWAMKTISVLNKESTVLTVECKRLFEFDIGGGNRGQYKWMRWINEMDWILLTTLSISTLPTLSPIQPIITFSLSIILLSLSLFRRQDWRLLKIITWTGYVCLNALTLSIALMGEDASLRTVSALNTALTIFYMLTLSSALLTLLARIMNIAINGIGDKGLMKLLRRA